MKIAMSSNQLLSLLLILFWYLFKYGAILLQGLSKISDSDYAFSLTKCVAYCS